MPGTFSTRHRRGSAESAMCPKDTGGTPMSRVLQCAALPESVQADFLTPDVDFSPTSSESAEGA